MSYLPRWGGLVLFLCSLPVAATTLPAKGLSMTDVERQYGEPREKLPPLGSPAVNRWVYDDYTVYFVGGTVTDTIAQQYHALPPAGTTAATTPGQTLADNEDAVEFRPLQQVGPQSADEVGNYQSDGSKTAPIFDNHPAGAEPVPASQPATSAGAGAPAAAEPVFKPLKPIPAAPEPEGGTSTAAVDKPSTGAPAEPVFKPLKPLTAAPEGSASTATAASKPAAPAPAAGSAAVNAALNAVTTREKAAPPPPPPPPPVDHLSSDGLFHRKGYAFDPVTGRIIVSKSAEAETPAPAAASGPAATTGPGR